MLLMIIMININLNIFKKKLIANIIMEESHSNNSTMQQNLLNDEWSFWAHLPHDTDWSVDSYKNIYTCKSVEDVVTLYETAPSHMIIKCMLFLMRKGITPLWEDPKNRNGGCFSYKVANKNVIDSWKSLSYLLVGESLSSNSSLQKSINGITISPKTNFCVIKIWMNNCDYPNASMITSSCGLNSHGCLFKKHAPEY